MRRHLGMLFLSLTLVLAILPPAARAQSQTPAISVALNDVPITMPAAPYIEKGVTMVPFRAIFEALQLTVQWNPATQTVKGANNWMTLELRVGDRNASVDGKPVSTDTPAVLHGASVYVPLRFIGEATGNIVLWDAAAHKIDIRSGHAWQGQVAHNNGRTRTLRLMRLDVNVYHFMSETKTTADGRFSFDGLEEGKDYMVQGAWPEDADIRPCQFGYRRWNLCDQLTSFGHPAAVFRIVTPDGDPIDSYSQPLALENAGNSVPLVNAPGMYVAESLTDGAAYTVSFDLNANLYSSFDAPAPYTFTYRTGEPVLYDLRLTAAPAPQAAGKLVNEAGTPFNNATIMVTSESKDSGRPAVRFHVPVQPDGSFALRGLVAGTHYSYDVITPHWTRPSLGDYTDLFSHAFEYSGAIVDLGTLTLHPIQLRGTIKDNAGHPLSASVVLKDASGNTIAVSSDGRATAVTSVIGAGYFGLGGMIEGQAYTVTATTQVMKKTKTVNGITYLQRLELPKPITFVYAKGMADIELVMN
ncbi:copper amine oxidase N-terminal domain-containing protein [Paenibacillus rhizovicinus]|uniref:Copper amine oxidase N-terminal domain-containing protein n=1 Tax=Paenibacillus rhizovicinus TaxID=2704463 RepID=A0A6C0P8B8_9BACL|nr:copper amine oxidase N-terminal domain-containing protein [Paenibacillus rhizovicinus]QHW34656.1 copper amine oxidase N-terminal domain-containing protein [Paenibacillus rhizovicinus]